MVRSLRTSNLLGISLLLGALLIAIDSVPVFAQGGSVYRQVVSPDVPTGTGQPAGGSTVRICPSTASGTPCSPLSTVYADPTLLVPIANPFAADIFGNYSVFLATGTYLVQETPVPGTTYSFLIFVNGTGTVSSVSLNLPSSTFVMTGQPCTAICNITGSFIAQAANKVFANCAGSTAIPNFCSITANMLPAILNSTTINGLVVAGNETVTGTLGVTGAGTFSSTLVVNGTSTVNGHSLVNIGTSVTPFTGLTFASPGITNTTYDASPRTTNSGAPNDGHIAPVALDQVYETGGATVAPRMFIARQQPDASATGTLYGIIGDVELLRGNRSGTGLGVGMANNIVFRNATQYFLSGCTRDGANTTTCTTTFPILSGGIITGDCVFVSGTLDAAYGSGLGCVPVTGVGSNTVTYTNNGAAGSTTGGTVANNFFNTFAFEMNHFQDAKQNGPISPVLGQTSPFNHTWVASSTGLYGPNTAFFSNSSTAVNQFWDPFVCSDAQDWCYVAGYPVSGAADMMMAGGFLADSINYASAGGNFNSVKYGWRNSWWNGIGVSNSTFTSQLIAEAGTSPQSHLDFVTPNATFTFHQNGELTVPQFRINVSGTVSTYRQIKRITTGSMAGTTRAEVLLTWDNNFADANYTVECSVEDSTTAAAVQGLTFERILTKNATQVGAVINNPTGGAITGTLDCSADHD